MTGHRLAAIALVVAVALLAGACTRFGQPTAPRAPGEPAPQVVQAAQAVADLDATCGGQTFPLAALDGPSVDGLPGPEFDALRRESALFTGHQPEFPAADNWRLVARQADRLLFVADSERGLWYLELAREADGWGFASGGDCNLHTVVGSGVGAAEWWLDPRQAAPTADSTVLEVLLMERACASGSYATGRIAAPLVLYGKDTITITMGVRHVGGNCPSNPATPAILVLSQPIGDRQLLDGFHVPPRPPGPPE